MKIPQETIDQIKASTDLVGYIRQHVKLDKIGKVFAGRCPFHDDHQRSLFVDPQKQLWNCLGACSANGNSGGDIFSFVMKRHGCNFREAVERLAPPKPISVSADVRCKAPALLSLVVDAYHRSYLESRSAQEYIASRGLDPALAKQYKAGYVDGSLLERVSRESNDWKLLHEIGIITEAGNEHFRTCVVFPLTALNQFTVNVYGRAIGKDQHLYLPGPRKGLFNWVTAKNYEELILAESILDALSFIQAGYNNVLPIYGINGFTQDHMDFIVRFRARKVILALDSDDAGKKAAAHIAEKIIAMHIATQILELPAKDANELLKKEGVEKFKAIVSELLKKETLQPSTTITETAKPEEGAPIAYIKGEAEGELSLTIDDRRYDLRAVPKRTYSQMRIPIQLTVSNLHYLDSVDLLSARARTGFAARCAAHFHIPNPILERDLYLILEAIDQYQKDQSQPAKQEKVEITESEKEEALSFLKSPELLDHVTADMETLGYVGEEHNKKLGYLIAVSRKLAEPLSAVILSQSGSGKSFLAEVLELLSAKEEMKMFSRLTPAALYYMEKDALVHKFVIVEERSGSAEADYSIRTLQSKKKLILAAVIKDPATGKIATKEFEIYGPTAFLETTTSPRINHENSTRCFEMYLDETAEQTGRIHRMQRLLKTSQGRELQAKWDAIRKKHHNAQRLLKPVIVIVDYAVMLDFPKTWLRTRRDNLRFLNLIEVIAFLHQYQKEIKFDSHGREYIEADLRDYEIACKL
ncbi:MAG: CHC2 zinc finger domain-containing protein, partial [Acidobacteriota bacterium]